MKTGTPTFNDMDVEVGLVEVILESTVEFAKWSRPFVG
jgi:hypothetical protein